MKAQITFDTYFKAMLPDDVKTCTTRDTLKANPLDTFDAFGHTFLVINVIRTTLEKAVALYFRQEGFGCREEMVAFWQLLYPGEFPGKRIVYVHFFTRLPKETKAEGET
jgi:hypothetical protein